MSNRSNGNSSPVHGELVWQEFAQSSVIRNARLFIPFVAWKHIIFCEKWTDQHDISMGWRILNLVMFIWIWIYHCLHWSWKAPMGSVQLSIHTQKILVPDKNRTHDPSNTRRALYPLSYENSWRATSFNWVHV